MRLWRSLGCYCRCGAATVAGVAVHVHLAVPETLVDFLDHHGHVASSYLLRFFVGGPVGDVAEGAGSLIQGAQCFHEALHRLLKVSRVDYLDIFEGRRATTFAAALAALAAALSTTLAVGSRDGQS